MFHPVKWFDIMLFIHSSIFLDIADNATRNEQVSYYLMLLAIHPLSSYNHVMLTPGRNIIISNQIYSRNELILHCFVCIIKWMDGYWQFASSWSGMLLSMGLPKDRLPRSVVSRWASYLCIQVRSPTWVMSISIRRNFELSSGGAVRQTGQPPRQTGQTPRAHGKVVLYDLM